jgi:hypothetical protein
MKTLKIDIYCGTKTCYNFETKTMCKYVGSMKFGQVPLCTLFPSVNNTYTLLNEDTKECLLRCEQCLESSKSE